MTGLGEYLKITILCDVPAGISMDSASSLTMGLLNALYTYKGLLIEILGKQIRRQNQHTAACGGVNYIRFNSNSMVYLEPVRCDLAWLNRVNLEKGFK